MARISGVNTADELVVAVVGPLAARDLRRLERVCGPAVERRARLRVIVQSGSTVDQFARAYLDRLRARGAVVEGA